MSIFEERYSDIQTKMDQSLGDVKIVYGEDSIAQSIKNILGIHLGERYKLPQFGSTLRRLLFEPISDLTAMNIEITVRDLIERWEDRITIDTIVVKPFEDENYYEIEVKYIMNTTGQRANFIGRVRAGV